MPIARIVTVLSLTALAFCASAAPAARAAHPVQCQGCKGSVGGSSTSGGSCGGFLSINVTLSKGKCAWVHSYEPWTISCESFVGCLPAVTRSWSGLPAGSDVDFCITLGPDELCLDPKPSVGSSGGGSDSRSSGPIECGTSRNFSLGSAACGLSVSTDATCASCSGF